jgi:putative transposase
MKAKMNAVGNYNVTYKHLPKPDNANPDKPYLLLPRIGTVRMTRPLRYQGRPVSVTIRQHNECFYACFLVEITEDEFYRLHKRYTDKPSALSAVGIDLGTKELAVTSDGLVIENPHHWERQLEHENRLQELMNHSSDKRKKSERKTFRPSKRFLKAKQKLWRQRTKIRNQREDFRNKFCAAVLTAYQHIGIETLSTKKMGDSMANRKGKKTMRKRVTDVSLYEIRHRLETLGELLGRNVKAAPNDYPSTRICCRCGHVEPPLRIDQRTYHCPKCGNTIDRDLNAAINLRKITGRGTSDSMPEVSLMHSDLMKSNIKYRDIDDGK